MHPIVDTWPPISACGVLRSQWRRHFLPSSNPPDHFRRATRMSLPATILREGPIEIRPATQADNEGLLALSPATPMARTIALRIDRDPDFFALLRMRSESIVYVAVRGCEVI